MSVRAEGRGPMLFSKLRHPPRPRDHDPRSGHRGARFQPLTRRSGGNPGVQQRSDAAVSVRSVPARRGRERLTPWAPSRRVLHLVRGRILAHLDRPCRPLRQALREGNAHHRRRGARPSRRRDVRVGAARRLPATRSRGHPRVSRVCGRARAPHRDRHGGMTPHASCSTRIFRSLSWRESPRGSRRRNMCGTPWRRSDGSACLGTCAYAWAVAGDARSGLRAAERVARRTAEGRPARHAPCAEQRDCIAADRPRRCDRALRDRRGSHGPRAQKAGVTLALAIRIESAQGSAFGTSVSAGVACRRRSRADISRSSCAEANAFVGACSPEAELLWDARLFETTSPRSSPPQWRSPVSIGRSRPANARQIRDTHPIGVCFKEPRFTRGSFVSGSSDPYAANRRALDAIRATPPTLTARVDS